MTSKSETTGHLDGFKNTTTGRTFFGELKKKTSLSSEITNSVLFDKP